MRVPSAHVLKGASCKLPSQDTGLEKKELSFLKKDAPKPQVKACASQVALFTVDPEFSDRPRVSPK